MEKSLVSKKPLKNISGKIDCGLTEDAKAKLRKCKVKDKAKREAIINNEDNHIFTYKNPDKDFTTEYQIHLLLGQYYSGISPKKELENLMNELSQIGNK